jgi:F-type H+-transporting ATPase subunit epsilon
MFEKHFHVEIIAPNRVVYKDEVAAVSVPGTVGGFQVLYDHAPLVSSLEVGLIKVRDREGHDILFCTSGGFAEVRDNVMSVLVESAERSEEIDVQRARAARTRAELRLRERKHDVDLVRAEAALRRSLNRLRLAGAV